MPCLLTIPYSSPAHLCVNMFIRLWWGLSESSVHSHCSDIMIALSVLIRLWKWPCTLLFCFLSLLLKGMLFSEHSLHWTFVLQRLGCAEDTVVGPVWMRSALLCNLVAQFIVLVIVLESWRVVRGNAFALFLREALWFFGLNYGGDCSLL